MWTASSSACSGSRQEGRPVRHWCQVAVLALLVPALSRAGDRERPIVSLAFPRDRTRVEYIIAGKFGQRRDFTTANGLTAEIKASADGHPADRIKLVAYIPGCALVKLDLKLAPEDHINRTLECEPLRTLYLSGSFDKPPGSPDSLQLNVVYFASAIDDFLGAPVAEDRIPRFDVARARPSNDGRFRVAVPDFWNDPNIPPQARGYFTFELVDPTTGNTVALLIPEESGGAILPLYLLVQDDYPHTIRFKYRPNRATAD